MTDDLVPPTPEEMRREFERIRSEIAARGISLDDLPGCSEPHKLYLYHALSGLFWLTDCEADAAMRGDTETAKEARGGLARVHGMLEEISRSCPKCFAELAALRDNVQ